MLVAWAVITSYSIHYTKLYDGGARLRLAADVVRPPWRGEATAEWEGIDLSRADPWLDDVELEGRTSGVARFRRLDDGGLEADAELSAAGRMRHGGRTLEVPAAGGELLV